VPLLPPLRRTYDPGRFFDKLHLLVDAPGAIEKMKELVLQLAVRGQWSPDAIKMSQNLSGSR
jgi:hypothetical protein